MAKFRTKMSKISTLFSDYCTSSSIHGVRYVGQFEKPLGERILWFAVIILCIYGSTKFSLDVLDKWENHPIIVSFEDTSTPINKIPFPAITICPGIKVKKKDFSFSDILQKVIENKMKFNKSDVGLTTKELDRFEALRNVKGCDEVKTVHEKNSRKMNKTIFKILREIAPPFHEIFKECWWEDRKVDCEQIWEKTLTMDGICYTFNSLGNKNVFRNETLHSDYVVGKYSPKFINWDPEIGYSENPLNTEFYPRNVATAGFEVGLYVELQGSSEDFDKYCGGSYPGFKLMLHAPNEIADAEKNFVYVPFENEVLVAAKPSMRSTSMDLKNVAHKKRQCFFESERYLKYFESYTEINCLQECWANYSLKLCGCNEFHIPRSANIPVCGNNKKDCLHEAFKVMVIDESGFGLCHCLPPCTSITYNMEASTSAIAQYQTNIFNKASAKANQTLQYATLSVFFKEDQFWSAKRSALFGKTEIMANCGGVLGLFLGFSILSLVEIFYFLTFRMIKTFRKENEDASDNS